MRQDSFACSLVVDGREAPITFNGRTGGEATSEEGKIFPGGGEPQKALGGPQTVENVTCSGEYEPELHDGYIKFLEARRGRGDAIVTELPLDSDNNVNGTGKVWRGKLMTVNTGDYDASSAEGRIVEIEVSTHGSIG